MSVWHPIETAPKDADLLLLCDVRIGHVGAGYWATSSHEVDSPSWICTESQGLTGGLMQPTHWMPLPDPPEETA